MLKHVLLLLIIQLQLEFARSGQLLAVRLEARSTLVSVDGMTRAWEWEERGAVDHEIEKSRKWRT